MASQDMIEHKITEAQLLLIEQAAGIVTRKDERLTDRLERIIAELELIRQKSNLVESVDVAEFKPATRFDIVKSKLAVFLKIR